NLCLCPSAWKGARQTDRGCLFHGLRANPCADWRGRTGGRGAAEPSSAPGGPGGAGTVRDRPRTEVRLRWGRGGGWPTEGGRRGRHHGAVPAGRPEGGGDRGGQHPGRG